jgi:hypothetical protein
MLSYCWFILGNGRSRYLERTIASWEANLLEKPDLQIIFDDSGSQEYRDWLEVKFGDRFSIIPIAESNAGHSASINFIFETLSMLDVDYALEVEEDWMLFRPISIHEIIKTLKKNPQLTQMRIPRTVWHESSTHCLDMEYGSLLRHYTENNFYLKHPNWYEFRTTSYFWSHNPCVFNVKVCENVYPDTGIASEFDFGISLLENNEKNTFAYWAKNVYDGYVTHIGYHEKFLALGIPEIF